MERHPASGTRVPLAEVVPARRRCNASGCQAEGHDVSDHYGIPAGRWCDDHESEAPGQWAYAGPDTEPLDEDRPNPSRGSEDW